MVSRRPVYLGHRSQSERFETVFMSASCLANGAAIALPTRSPTIIAGLRRIATSLWLHFVALPQRVPGIGHRRRSRPVVNVIDKMPPRAGYDNVDTTHAAYPSSAERRSTTIFRLRRAGARCKKRVVRVRGPSVGLCTYLQQVSGLTRSIMSRPQSPTLAYSGLAPSSR